MKKNGATPTFSALVLSWNELDVVKKTIERLKKEPIEIWVVDNGSEDGTQKYLKTQILDGINVIQLPENIGAGPARNKVLYQFNGDYLLMLDGDICYIPGSIKPMRKILDNLPKNAYCLGIHNSRWDGTDVFEESHQKWERPGLVKCDFPMAWTQYGLFKGSIIRNFRFPEKGPFYGPGYGYEDDYLNALLEEAGYKSYYCDHPLYYHKAHSGREQFKDERDRNEEARKEALKKRFPNYKHWMEVVA